MNSPLTSVHTGASGHTPETAASTTGASPSRRTLTPILAGVIGAVLITAGSFGTGAQAGSVGPASAEPLAFLAIGSGEVASILLVWSGVILCVLAWLALGLAVSRGARVRWSVVVAAWTLPLLPALPVFSGDAWTYLAQGEMLSGPADPYVDGTGAAGGALSAHVHPDWRFTPTPYGPLHLLLMQGTVSVSGHSGWPSIIALRVLTLGFIALAAFALSRLAAHTGARRDSALWLGIANPLVVVHLVGGLHNDAMILAFALLGLWLAAASAREIDPRRRLPLLAAAGVLIGLAVTIKVTSLLLLPFAAWVAGRAFIRAFARGVWMTAFAAATGAIVTLVSGAGIGWIDALSVSDRVVYWIALPTAIAHLASAFGAGTFEDTLAVARSACMAAGAVALAACWWLARPHKNGGEGDPADLANRALVWLTAAWTVFFVVNVLSWPWYWTVAIGTWAAVGAAYTGLRSRAALSVAVAIIVFQLLATDPGGTPTLYTPTFAITATIACLVAAWWTYRRLARTPSPAPGA